MPARHAELQEVLADLIQREPIFHRAEFGTTRADFERMTEVDFWETGASGKRYSREVVLDILQQRLSQAHDDPWETRDFRCQQIAPDNFLLTYTLAQGARLTQRATLWRRVAGEWKIVYHQGTLVAGD